MGASHPAQDNRELLIPSVLNAIPFVGQGLSSIYIIIDSLFIFRADRRTIHDFIAGTRVDKVA